jgi:hypothetical protein
MRSRDYNYELGCSSMPLESPCLLLPLWDGCINVLLDDAKLRSTRVTQK